MPRGVDTERTRIKIILSAMEVFGRGGFQGASMDEIARKAGITKGALYWHFEGKLDLYMAVFDHAMGEYSRSLDKAIISASDPRSILEDLASRIFAIYMEDTAVSRFYSSMMMDSKLVAVEGIASRVAQVYSDYRKAIVGIIKHWDTGKKFNRTQLRIASLSYVALIEGIAVQWMVDKKSIDLRREGMRAVKNFLEGIEPVRKG